MQMITGMLSLKHMKALLLTLSDTIDLMFVTRVYWSTCRCVCTPGHLRECALYANCVNVCKLLKPILIRFSLVLLMEMPGVCIAELCLHQPGCLTLKKQAGRGDEHLRQPRQAKTD